MKDLIALVHKYTTVYRNGPEATVNGEAASQDEVRAVMDETASPAKRTSNVNVVEVFGYPPVGAASEGQELIDMLFVTVGIDAEASRHVQEIKQALAGYPQPDRLAGGPSYIEIGGVLGDQEAALRLMALGQALGLWDVISGVTIGMGRDQALALAGKGFLMTSGYKQAAA